MQTLNDESIKAEEKEIMYESLSQLDGIDLEDIEHFESCSLLYLENQIVFLADICENEAEMADEVGFLELLEIGLPEQYKEIIFDITHVRYILELDPQYRNLNLEFV